MTIEQAHNGGITSAHSKFEQLTGKQYQLHTHRSFLWEKFLVHRKFTEADIEIVVPYLRGEIAAKRAFPPQLWFANLIEQPDKFEEYLGDAKAKSRNALPAKSSRDSVLEAAGISKQDRKTQINVISMNDRVRWHLDEMRKAASFHALPTDAKKDDLK